MKTDMFLCLTREQDGQSHLTVVRVDDLEVLDGGLGDTSVEVEHI